jgi:hypothetical protein
MAYIDADFMLPVVQLKKTVVHLIKAYLKLFEITLHYSCSFTLVDDTVSTIKCDEKKGIKERR